MTVLEERVEHRLGISGYVTRVSEHWENGVFVSTRLVIRGESYGFPNASHAQAVDLYARLDLSLLNPSSKVNFLEEKKVVEDPENPFPELGRCTMFVYDQRLEFQTPTMGPFEIFATHKDPVYRKA